MKKSISFIATLFAAAAAIAQNTDVRQLPEFSGIEIRSSSIINLRQDSVQSVRVSTDDPLERVVTRVENSTLYIEGKGSSTMDISMKEIRKLVIGGRGEIEGLTAINSPDLQLQISGDGKMDLNLAVKD